MIAAIDELVATLDVAIPAPVRDFAAPFLMPVETVLTIDGIGTVVTGRVTRGTVAVGDTLEIVGRRLHDDVGPSAVSARATTC